MARDGVVSRSTVVLAALTLVGGASAVGPDVIVGDIPSLVNWTTGGSVGGIRAYNAGTTSCNIGDADVLWTASTSQHPAIAQELYRLKDGRFEQIGYSWLKHALSTLVGQLCAPPPSCNGHCCAVLGVGCSDPYGAGQNGSYSTMGPRFLVNASNGVFPMPYGGTAPNNPPIGKRIQVLETDLNPALNPGALYFVSAHYVTADDAQANNGRNNMSYRRVTVGPMPALEIDVAGSTQRMQPGIQGWKDTDAGVTLHPVDYADSGVTARFWIGARATDLGGGMWHYEYAVQNLNSDRSAGSFSVPTGPGVVVSNVGFHDVNAHSGDGPGSINYSGADWTATVTSTAITWSAESFDVNPSANAIRWGRLYNFRFDANVPPTTGDVTLGLFKPGAPASLIDNTVVPAPMPSIPGDLNGDGVVNTLDLGILLSSWTIPPSKACSLPCPADLNGDGVVNTLDLGIVLSSWTL